MALVEPEVIQDLQDAEECLDFQVKRVVTVLQGEMVHRGPMVSQVTRGLLGILVQLV